jgi:hypothetical protein
MAAAKPLDKALLVYAYIPSPPKPGIIVLGSAHAHSLSHCLTLAGPT